MIKKIKDIILQKGGLGKFIRYVLVGASAVIVDFAVFNVLLFVINRMDVEFLMESEKIANSVAVVTGFVYSFILNRSWAFKSQGKALNQIIMMLMLLVINTVISNEAISFMIRNLGFIPALAKLIMQVVVAAWNYFIYDKIIYRS